MFLSLYILKNQSEKNGYCQFFCTFAANNTDRKAYIMRIPKVFLFIVGLLMTTTVVEAQENETDFETTIAADVVSQYVWRGQDLGDVSLQPTFGVAYKGLSLTAWGNVGLSNADDTKEIDLTLAYTLGGFNIGVTDYWTNDGQDPRARYFKYQAHETNHVFEANVGYDFGVANIQWYTNFAGNDGVNNDDKRAYSSYFEVSALFRLATCDWTATVGAVPFATDYYDTSGFAVTNLSLQATKDIHITDTFSIPVFGQVTANPRTQKAYLVFGFTLQP